ncbi:MAG TPA: PKD domain-containing protein, partial [Chitinophagales bacterium]|nr:PKD domain-containing protein [Chitinophagales bacterium]
MSKNILHSISETSTVDVGLEPGVSGDYTFTFDGLSSFDPTSYITLEDKKQATFYDVRAGSYNFTADAADNRDRFVLHFTPKAEVAVTDQVCETRGVINITQPGTANWYYTLTDNNNSVIDSGSLNSSSSITATVPMGTYFLNLVDSNNYSIVKTITVNGTQPDAAVFTPSSATAETTDDITFTSTTTNAADYSWDFGDGTIVNTQLPTVTHQYQVAGSYTVTLTVTNVYGCHSTTTQVVTVTQKVIISGLTAVTQQSPINVWSNENMVYVDFRQLAKTDATIEIYNALGQQLVNERYGRSTIYTKHLDIGEAAYIMIRVTNGELVTAKKLFLAK